MDHHGAAQDVFIAQPCLHLLGQEVRRVGAGVVLDGQPRVLRDAGAVPEVSAGRDLAALACSTVFLEQQSSTETAMGLVQGRLDWGLRDCFPKALNPQPSLSVSGCLSESLHI